MEARAGSKSRQQRYGSKSRKQEYASAAKPPGACTARCLLTAIAISCTELACSDSTLLLLLSELSRAVGFRACVRRVACAFTNGSVARV
jgi:hypothetical protein